MRCLARRIPPLPMAAPAVRSVSAQALDSAAAYAGAMQSDALLVWQGGALQSATYYGGFQRTDLVASKSMAKMVVGLVIGRAIALGHIRSVDQPVADFISEWQGTPKVKPTIRHLLWNSSGLSRFNYNDFKPWSLTMREYLSESHERILIDETQLEYEPGSEYDYSMITSDLLAIIIERATGKRYADFVSEALIKPIGALGGTVYINRPGGLAHSGCCLMLPTESFVRIGILLANDGVWNGNRLLPEGWVKETVSPSPANPNWGLHMWIGQPFQPRLKWFPDRSQKVGVLQSEPYLAPDLFLFDGSGNQVMYIVPSRQLVVLRVGPRPKPATGEWDNATLINGILRGLAAPQPETP
jgi:CubicO group peptidase (beta-lactamase class C family)